MTPGGGLKFVRDSSPLAMHGHLVVLASTPGVVEDVRGNTLTVLWSVALDADGRVVRNVLDTTVPITAVGYLDTAPDVRRPAG